MNDAIVVGRYEATSMGSSDDVSVGNMNDAIVVEMHETTSRGSTDDVSVR